MKGNWKRLDITRKLVNHEGCCRRWWDVGLKCTRSGQRSGHAVRTVMCPDGAGKGMDQAACEPQAPTPTQIQGKKRSHHVSMRKTWICKVKAQHMAHKIIIFKSCI